MQSTPLVGLPPQLAWLSGGRLVDGTSIITTNTDIIINLVINAMAAHDVHLITPIPPYC